MWRTRSPAGDCLALNEKGAEIDPLDFGESLEDDDNIELTACRLHREHPAKQQIEKIAHELQVPLPLLACHLRYEKAVRGGKPAQSG